MATVLDRVRLSQIIAMVGYAVLCSFCLLLLVYLRVNRHVAFKGDAQATRKVLLPAFEPLLWILAVFTGSFVGFFCIALHIQMYTTSFPRVDAEFIYSGRQFVFVLALMFLCQKSVSVPALRRAVAKSVLLATYTVPVVWILNHFFPTKNTLFFFVRLFVRPTILIFVVYVCFISPPGGRASPLTLRIHGAYIIMYHVLSAINSLIQNYAPESPVYAATTYMVLTWGSCTPFFIWSLLRADTEYWRGMGERVCIQDGQFNPHLDECISANQIHTLIEMHRDFLIDFAHLELRQKIGEGSSASVFSGQLRQRKPVAVKVYTPYRYTEEVVAEFSHEAALCASLRHPNIVKFFGMCVRPPTICLVSELCQGSLEDVLYTHTKTRRKHRVTRHVLELEGQVEAVEVVDRQQMLLNIAYMLDCARAVAYVHSFTPPFLHRDIKPANFLVDNDNSVKLTDFGDSRRLPRGFPSKTDEPQTSIGTITSTDSPIPTRTAPAPPQIKMTVTGTVSYMPPEMISCRTGLATYGEAADVYSLAITFWDILNPDREKYSATNPMLVFEGVLNGCRPLFEETEALPGNLRELIISAWHCDPSMRPTMPQIVLALEEIQEELLSVLAQQLSEEINRSGTDCHVAPIEKCFTGEYMVERMEDLDLIDSRGEGVRLGRALMDAGFLHHLRHERGFDDTNAMYFFDDSNINFCQPLAMLEEGSGTSPESDDEPCLRPTQRRSPPTAKSKSSKRSKLFSHLTSTFSAGHNSVGEGSSTGSKAGGCACRQRGRRELVPIHGHQRKHRVWLRSPPRAQSRSQRIESNSSSSCCSSSSTGFPLSPKRWKRKKREENPLTHKLLDNVQDHTIDIVDEEVMESLSLVRPAA
ncbi:Serine/threonine-protein kinase STY17 [Phytophthora citrophthora]|uniref:Serine/threonine-protein kinase STY17 n=1 Tax=Phytophthora citrophthora TaxID=4793 RepID=A0AAD9LDD0_9STRA|nr:Serine/threonine-protein kinase STY17 [Phytophthora citrophthora]